MLNLQCLILIGYFLKREFGRKKILDKLSSIFEKQNKNFGKLKLVTRATTFKFAKVNGLTCD